MYLLQNCNILLISLVLPIIIPSFKILLNFEIISHRYIITDYHSVQLTSIHIVVQFFLVIRTFKIYSLSNFQIYNATLLPIVTTVPYIIPRACLKTENVYLLTKFIHFTHWALILTKAQTKIEMVSDSTRNCTR